MRRLFALDPAAARRVVEPGLPLALFPVLRSRRLGEVALLVVEGVAHARWALGEALCSFGQAWGEKKMETPAAPS